MAGLLDFTQTPEGMQGLALLAAAAPSMEPTNFAARLAQAGNTYNGLLGNQLKSKFIQSQIDENASQAAERKALADAKAAELARQQRILSGLPKYFGGGGLTGGEAVPQSLGGVPMFSQPMGVSPMQTAPAGAFNWRAAMLDGMKPEEIEKYAKLPDIGKAEVARTVEVDDGKGGKETIQLDKFGNRVGSGMAAYIAPVEVNQGNRKTFVRPTPGLSLDVGVSPDTVYQGNITMRGQNMTDRRSRETAELGTIPSGYRRKLDGSGLEFIPGGPADPAAAKKAAPTEFQGKSTTFAARMQDAAKVLGELEGKVSPMEVARAGYTPDVPAWLGGSAVGAPLAAAAKLSTSSAAQRYAQAQENWVTANLRQESGAAIGKEEMAKDIRKWFPQPGDSEEVKAQKAAARQVAERAMLVQSGPGATSIPSIVNGDGVDKSPAATAPVQWRYVNGKLQKVQ